MRAPTEEKKTALQVIREFQGIESGFMLRLIQYVLYLAVAAKGSKREFQRLNNARPAEHQLLRKHGLLIEALIGLEGSELSEATQDVVGGDYYGWCLKEYDSTREEIYFDTLGYRVMLDCPAGDDHATPFTFEGLMYGMPVIFNLYVMGGRLSVHVGYLQENLSKPIVENILNHENRFMREKTRPVTEIILSDRIGWDDDLIWSHTGLWNEMVSFLLHQEINIFDAVRTGYSPLMDPTKLDVLQRVLEEINIPLTNIGIRTASK